jgi:hypothetical protein
LQAAEALGRARKYTAMLSAAGFEDLTLRPKRKNVFPTFAPWPWMADTGAVFTVHSN